MPLKLRLQSNGSFADLDNFVEHLGEGATIALAIAKRMPKRRSNVCARSQINCLLLGPVEIPPANASHKEEL